jgi:hypothetical protein
MNSRIAAIIYLLILALSTPFIVLIEIMLALFGQPYKGK